jgi:hypothetical protein
VAAVLESDAVPRTTRSRRTEMKRKTTKTARTKTAKRKTTAARKPAARRKATAARKPAAKRTRAARVNPEREARKKLGDARVDEIQAFVKESSTETTSIDAVVKGVRERFPGIPIGPIKMTVAGLRQPPR